MSLTSFSFSPAFRDYPLAGNSPQELAELFREHLELRGLELVPGPVEGQPGTVAGLFLKASGRLSEALTQDSVLRLSESGVVTVFHL